jgi:Protein of unknown function (DUF2631)
MPECAQLDVADAAAPALTLTFKGAAVANTEVERHTGVDVEDVPSANWGWSKENYRWIHIGGILSAIFTLAMLRGNHVGKVEDVFVIFFALVILVIVGRDWWMRRRGWSR